MRAKITVRPASPVFVLELTQEQAVALVQALGPLSDRGTYEIYSPLLAALRDAGVNP